VLRRTDRYEQLKGMVYCILTPSWHCYPSAPQRYCPVKLLQAEGPVKAGDRDLRDNVSTLQEPYLTCWRSTRLTTPLVTHTLSPPVG
jgi:hypothetical protein